MAYLKTINTALETLRANAETKHLAKMGLDKLLQHIDQVPKDLQGPVRNGGEHARCLSGLHPVSSVPFRPVAAHVLTPRGATSRLAAAREQAGAL